METIEPKTVILQDEEVVSMLSVNPTVDTFKTGVNQGKEFYRATHAGRTFVVTPEFKEAWDNGEVATVTLTDNPYEQEIDDPDNVGQKLKVKRISWTMTYATTKQLEQIQKAKQNRINNSRKLKLEAAIDHRRLLDDTKLDESAVKELMSFL